MNGEYFMPVLFKMEYNYLGRSQQKGRLGLRGKTG
jgi:hypothetical protein